MSNTYKLGSLFDGSGGFPLAGSLCGITPAWASEVEPYPIAVTRSRFPSMKHLGDISKINGGEIEPVHAVTFGSPCQDLSVAGKRAGLKHEANGDEETTRSGLFMEAVRIFKEMRRATNGLYPRFALWENVPGAFSSNKGEDFRIVLQELIQIVEPCATVPPVPKGGWPYSDVYMGDGWSLAYRTFDAQYWGVPQRRRRIHLVIDFGGECAGKVLFERDGLRGYFAQSGAQGQGIAPDAQGSPGADDRAGEIDCIGFHLLQDPVPNTKCFPCMGQGNSDGGQASIGVAIGYDMYNQASTGNISRTLKTPVGGDDLPVVCYPVNTKDGDLCGCECVGVFASSAVNAEITDGTISPCLMARAGTGGNQLPLVAVTFDARGNGDGATVSTITGDHENRVTDYTNIICMATQQGGAEIRTDDKAPTVTAAAGMSGNNQPVVAYGINGDVAGTLDASYYKGCGMRSGVEREVVFQVEEIAYAIDCRNLREVPEVFQTLQAKPNGGQSLNFSGAVRVRYIVRRLTPTECARLQGFADRWGDIDRKEDFTDDEYRFWLEVRNTHAAINGKAVKEYTKAQMLTWYNKLRTDSSEYKMWGNGIALPPALYCMQGIVDALEVGV